MFLGQFLALHICIVGIGSVSHIRTLSLKRTIQFLDWKELFLLVFCSLSKAPGKPSTIEVVNTTAIQVNISLTITRFYVSQYCVTFQRTSVSNMPDTSPNVTVLCSQNSTITLSPVEEDATFQYAAIVNNTAGIQGPPTSGTVTTNTARKFSMLHIRRQSTCKQVRKLSYSRSGLIKY